MGKRDYKWQSKYLLSELMCVADDRAVRDESYNQRGRGRTVGKLERDNEQGQYRGEDDQERTINVYRYLYGASEENNYVKSIGRMVPGENNNYVKSIGRMVPGENNNYVKSIGRMVPGEKNNYVKSIGRMVPGENNNSVNSIGRMVPGENNNYVKSIGRMATGEKNNYVKSIGRMVQVKRITT